MAEEAIKALDTINPSTRDSTADEVSQEPILRSSARL